MVKQYYRVLEFYRKQLLQKTCAITLWYVYNYAYLPEAKFIDILICCSTDTPYSHVVAKAVCNCWFSLYCFITLRRLGYLELLKPSNNNSIKVKDVHVLPFHRLRCLCFPSEHILSRSWHVYNISGNKWGQFKINNKKCHWLIFLSPNCAYVICRPWFFSKDNSKQSCVIFEIA